MGPEAFYATAAQVLPTILIAVAVEAGLLMSRQVEYVNDARQMLSAADDTDHRGGVSRWLRRSTRRIIWGRRGAAATGVLFIVGQSAAMAVLYFGQDVHIPLHWAAVRLGDIAAPLIGVAILSMCVLAVTLPFLRLPRYEALLAAAVAAPPAGRKNSLGPAAVARAARALGVSVASGTEGAVDDTASAPKPSAEDGTGPA